MHEILRADATLTGKAAAEFDCQIVDPPYAARVHSRATSAGTGGRGVRKRDLGFACLTPELMLAIARNAALVRRWTAVFTDIESVHHWRMAFEAAGVKYVRAVPWVRWSQPQLSGDRPPSGCEMVVLAHRKGRKAWTGPGSLTALRAKSLRGADKHPTEKPLDLILALVSWLSSPGEAVLDPCCGRGTTVLAARLLGRDAVGLDTDAAHVADAQARLTGALSARDRERVQRFCVAQVKEARQVPAPRASNGSDVKTYERAQRRLEDAATVVAALEEK